MSTLMLKSLLSIGMVLSASFAIFTMFEIFGRGEKRYDVLTIKRLHKINGIVYFAIFVIVAYFCIRFIATSKAELTPRGAFHSIFALAILVLIGLKILVVRVYRQFYGQVKTVGLSIALITFGMVGSSAGYYLLVSDFGKDDRTFVEGIQNKRKDPVQGKENKKEGLKKITVRTDAASISKGEDLFNSKCYFCHDANSTKKIVGPGLKGVLKNPNLPVSRKPATAENVANQLRNPYKDMPSFSFLPKDDVLNIIAFLNTL